MNFNLFSSKEFLVSVGVFFGLLGIIVVFGYFLNILMPMPNEIAFLLYIAILAVVWEISATKITSKIMKHLNNKKTDELLYGDSDICEYCLKPMNFNNPSHTEACTEHYRKKAQDKK